MSPTVTLPCPLVVLPRTHTAGALWQLSRPLTLPAPALGISCGAVAGLAAVGATADGAWAGNVAMGAAAFSLLNAGSNALNQYCDRAADALDKPTRPLPSGRLTGRGVLGFSAACYLAASALVALVTSPSGLAFAGLFGAALFATVAYSVPPLRTKPRWWAALPTIALARGLVLFAAGWSLSAPIDTPTPWVIGGVLALFLLGAGATKDWSDRRGDAATGCRTLPLVYGSHGAAARVAPFFVAPWPLLFLLGVVGVAPGANLLALAVTALGLTAWGAVAARLLFRDDTDRLPTGRNHPAWGHMYAMLAAAHLGIAASYLLAH